MTTFAPFGFVRSFKVRRALPLVLFPCALSGFQAVTAQEISSSTSEPVNTSTIDNGAPADITITSDGTIEIADTDGVTAVTVDSDNSVTNSGLIQIDDSDNATGILVTADRAGDITNDGTLSVIEDYTREDDDGDDDLDGAYAIGTGRTGILLEAGGTHVGDIALTSNSVIAVEGNDSAGIQLLSILDGNLTQDGSLTALGDNAVALDIAEDVTGNVLISGLTTGQGENAEAISVEGDIGGALTIESTVQSTGFAATTISNYVAPSFITDDTPAIEDRIDAEDLLDNSATVSISGSLADGLLVNGAVDDFISTEDSEDETKDTVDDFDENRSTGTISSFGSGEALLISAENGDGTDIVLGAVTETVRDTTDDDEDEDTDETLATFDFDQGFINRGSVSANGLNVGFNATAVRIEGATSGGAAQTIIDGGILNTGTIAASAFEADATALSIGTNTVIGNIQNDGTISASVATLDGNTATAILLEDGSDIASFTNTGTIGSQSTGFTGTAIGVQDLSGQLSTVVNNGTVQATLASDGTDTEISGEAIAFDLSNSVLDISLVQDFETPVDDTNGDDVIDEDDVATPSITGDILFGSGNDAVDILAGGVIGNLDYGTGDGELELDNSLLTGLVSFEDGTHSVTANNASIIGALNFLDSTADVSLSNGTTFVGFFDTENAVVDLDISASAVTLGSGNRSVLNSLSVAGDSDLTFNVDPADVTGAVLTVNGAANIGSDVTIIPVLTSIVEETFTQTLISADALTFEGALADTESENVPFLYNLNLQLNEANANQLDLVFDLKSPAQLGFDANQAAGFAPLLAVFAGDDDLGSAFAAINNEQEFSQTYNLLLPQRTNASTEFLSAFSSAATGALNDRLYLLTFTENGDTGVWAQEHIVDIQEDATVENPGFNGTGAGFTFGVDRTFFGIDRVGLLGSYSTGKFEEKTGGNNPVNTVSFGGGLYAMESVGPVELRLSGQVASVDFTSTRDFNIGDLPFSVKGDWSGVSQSLSASAVSEFEMGMFYARPELSADWFKLSQDAYVETSESTLEQLNANVSEVDTEEMAVTANVALGTEFNFDQGLLRIEARGGYRSISTETPYSAVVSFVGAPDDSFTLAAPESESGSALFGLHLIGDSSFVSSRVGYDLEVSDDRTIHVFGATIRFKF